MFNSVRIFAAGRRNWLQAALRPTNLRFVLMVPALWLALISMAGLAERGIFAPHNRLPFVFLAAACFPATLLIVGFLASFRHSTRLAERENLIARQKMQLDAALANMPEGLCMFDRDQRLIVCNQQYAELYQLSKEQAQPGTSLRSILEHHVAIGNVIDDADEFVARRVYAVSAGKEYQHINKLRDGRLILVTRRPVDDGGWVATHKDVTDQVSREEFDPDPVRRQPGADVGLRSRQPAFPGGQ